MVCGEVEMALTPGPFGRIASTRALTSPFLCPISCPSLEKQLCALQNQPLPAGQVGRDALISHLLAPYAAAALGMHMEKSNVKPKGNVRSVAVPAAVPCAPRQSISTASTLMTLLWPLCLSGHADCSVVNGSAQIAAPDESL